MTTDVFETVGSQGTKLTAAGDGDGLSLRLMVTGTDDRDEAINALLAELNNVVYLRGSRPVVADAVDMQEVAPGFWSASVEFVPPEDRDTNRQPKAIGEVTFEFDGTGGTVKILQAYEQTKYGTNAPDHGKSINVTADGVDGVEVVVPKLSFTVSQRFDGATITLPWLRTVVGLTGTVNSDSFLGFDAGEVLFLGPAGQQPFHFNDNGTVVAGERDVTFRFAVSPNRTGLDVGTISGIAKKGHDYLWVQHESGVDATANGMTRKPVGVYVATVYEEKAFSALGINDPGTNYPVSG